MVITNGRSDISTITMVSWFIIKLVCNKLKTMVYGRYIYSIRGRFSATYNWGTTLYGLWMFMVDISTVYRLGALKITEEIYR